MMERRKGRDTLGPGKLTQALGINKGENQIDLTETNSSLWIEAGQFIPDKSVTIGPRVGLYTVSEPWKSMPWRFLMKSS
jgi:DNA-3-methyladenine glycosylase